MANAIILIGAVLGIALLLALVVLVAVLVIIFVAASKKKNIATEQTEVNFETEVKNETIESKTEE